MLTPSHQTLHTLLAHPQPWTSTIPSRSSPQPAYAPSLRFDPTPTGSLTLTSSLKLPAAHRCSSSTTYTGTITAIAALSSDAVALAARLPSGPAAPPGPTHLLARFTLALQRDDAAHDGDWEILAPRTRMVQARLERGVFATQLMGAPRGSCRMRPLRYGLRLVFEEGIAEGAGEDEVFVGWAIAPERGWV